MQVIPSYPLKKVCLLGIAFDNPNLGVGALADGAIRTVLHANPDAEISIMDYGYTGYDYLFVSDRRVVPIKFVNIRFSKAFYLENNIAYLIALAALVRYVLPAALGKRVVARNATLQHLSAMDLVGSVAGGDSFSDIYGLARLLYVSLPQILALIMGKKLILFPQTIGPFRSRFAKRIAKFILSRADLVYSRDAAGIEQARALTNRKGGIKFSYDVGFLVEPKAPSELKTVGLLPGNVGSCTVGVNVSGLLLAGGYDGENMFGLTINYEELVCEIIKCMIVEKGAIVLLVPHVCDDLDGSGQIESDVSACERIYQKLSPLHPGRIGVVVGKYNSNEIKYSIGACDFFIGARMHACIASLSQCIPAIAISYSDKFMGVMSSIGMGELVTDPRKMSTAEILNVVSRSFDRKDILRRQLEVTMPVIKENAARLLLETEVSAVCQS